MNLRKTGCGAPESMGRKDAFLAAGWTIGAALIVAAIMLVGNGPVTETIGLVMTPGVLVVGVQVMYLRGRSPLAKVALIGGQLVLLFLIGLLAGLVQAN